MTNPGAFSLSGVNRFRDEIVQRTEVVQLSGASSVISLPSFKAKSEVCLVRGAQTWGHDFHCRCAFAEETRTDFLVSCSKEWEAPGGPTLTGGRGFQANLLVFVEKIDGVPNLPRGLQALGGEEVSFVH